MYRKMSLVKFVAILATATVSQFYAEALYRQTVVAQSFGETPESFPVPDSLPDGTTLKLDGSTSMRLTNETLEQRFEAQFPNIDVELSASRTDKAFEALINGDIDVLSTGRPLTDAEKAQGVVEVPLEQREKLAIILGPDNTFEGDLTFEQFAGIFRGEITNWSEIGGPNLPIRLVDRPDYSDTRRALSTYTVFEGKPFETGATADPVDDDETDTVVKALGNDGIGYSVVSQVIDRDDVRIIPMHQTLPDDPRYPYSQYRAFAYKQGTGPAALAFMGFATTEPGKEVFESEPAVVDSPTAADTPTPTDTAATPAPAPEPEAPPAPEATAAPAAGAPAADRGGFPLWLLPLLAIPLLGGLLWWLLKGSNAAAPATATTAAVAGGAATVPMQPRLVLVPRDCRHAYAYWEIPKECLTETKRQGGETMMIRLYEVTGRSKNSPLPPHAAEFPCLEANPDLHLPITVDDRSYCAEVGYLGKDKQWLPIVKSDPVRVPICPKDETPSDTVPAASVPATSVNKPAAGVRDLGGAVLGGAALAGGAALGATKLADGKAKTPTGIGRMILTPRNAQDVYAYWEIPQQRFTDTKLQGGETMVAKLYDITDRPAAVGLPEPIAQLECTEADMDAHFPITSERDYVAELGYQTTSGNWLPLAQSNSVRVPADIADIDSGRVVNTLPDAAGAAAVVAATAAMGTSALTVEETSTSEKASTSEAKSTSSTVTQSRIVMTPQTAQRAYVYWEVPETAKSALKVEGGQVYQLRMHDVTDIELDQQSPNSTLTYDLLETDCDRTVPIPNDQNDYVAEVGYQTLSGDWLTLARSKSLNPAQSLAKSLDAKNLADRISKSSLASSGMAMGAAGVAAIGGLAATAHEDQSSSSQLSESNITVENGTDTVHADSTASGTTQIVKVHSRNNAVVFDEAQRHHIEYDVASTYQLTPGIYTLRLRDGVFNYDADDNHPGEPFVLLWIHGGTIINQKTGVPISSTWTTLNGYDDTLILDVREPAKLCAFFVDTYPDDNLGEVILSVIKQ